MQPGQRLFKAASWGLIITGVLVGFEAYYRISPPLVLLTVVAGLFLLSWIRLPATA